MDDVTHSWLGFHTGLNKKVNPELVTNCKVSILILIVSEPRKLHGLEIDYIG